VNLLGIGAQPGALLVRCDLLRMDAERLVERVVLTLLEARKWVEGGHGLIVVCPQLWKTLGADVHPLFT
jgi:hypothetical protein